MVELKAVELVIKVPYILAVGRHLWVEAARLLHDLVDNMPGPPPGSPGVVQTVNYGFMLGHIT